MPITGWIAILVLIVMCYMLIKQYETRMVLFGGGFILCCISLSPMAGLNAFAKTMTNGALIMAICSATGFAYCVTFTECDRSLVHYLTRPIRNVGILMIPITSLGTTHYTTGAGNIKRFNMFNSAVIRGGAADGYSSGQAMEIIEQIAREHLPENIGVEWSGLSYQEKQAGGQTAMALALVFLFVFLFLAALYESWTVPIAVLLSLPIAALGAYLGVWTCGLENDVYFQIGLVMLVGLAAKNAILIVEFAKEQVDRGANVVKAALHASQLRFRPILMTSLAFILGMLPMVIASGPGSASRQAIGTGVFFGMILAVTVGILLVPFFFVLIYKAKAKAKSANIKKVTKRFKR